MAALSFVGQGLRNVHHKCCRIATGAQRSCPAENALALPYGPRLNTLREEEVVVLDTCPGCSGQRLHTLLPPAVRRIFVTDGPEMSARIGVCACKTCGLIVLNPRLSTASLGRYYARQSRMPRESMAPDSPIARMMSDQIELILHQKTLAPGAAVLEIGCAEGYFLDRLRQRVPGIEVRGIEPSARYAESARRRMPHAAIQERILDAAAPADLGTHDLVVVRHVLEHLPQPVADLKLIRRLLSQAGVIYIEVPDVANIPPAIYYYFHHEHLTYFSRETMEACLARAGLRILALQQFRGYEPGSGFAYPVLRVLATAGDAGAAKNYPLQPDAIWRRFKANETAFLNQRLGAATTKLDAAIRAGKRLALFGAGPHTVDLLHRLEPVTYPWMMAFDNHPGKTGKLLCGIPIVAPTREAFDSVDTVLVSSLEFEREMVGQMRAIAGERLEIIPLYAGAEG